MKETKEKSYFFENINTEELLKTYGSPLYVYREDVLRERCRELKSMVQYPGFVIDYSMKANSNPALLQIIRKEGLEVDVMSPGEIYLAQKAGYKEKEIFYICNNVSLEEMTFAVENGVKISVDSLSQLETYGEHYPGTEIAIRVNPGIGAGHHKKVVTAGKETKFGIDAERIEEIKRVLTKYNLKLMGINQHIGSLFLKPEDYLRSIDSLFAFAKEFEDLKFVDFGGGLGMPYHRDGSQERLDLAALGEALDAKMYQFVREYGKEICFRIEPGRYVAAECGAILGKVQSVKDNHGNKYVGTDVGFNVLMRPILYDSYHEIAAYRNGQQLEGQEEAVTVVGNICESGDIIAKDRVLPGLAKGDVLAILDAGAYGHVMSSNYNGRLRPAEVLVQENGEVKVIRRRDRLEDLAVCYDC